jgi:periplasmic protein TonB
MRLLKNISTVFFILISMTVAGQTDSSECISIIKDTALDRQLYVLVDKMPEFPGGQDSLNKFLRKQDSLNKYLRNYVQYPNTDNVGPIYVSFVVERNGELTNKKLIKGIDNKVDKMALAVLDLMPKWTPGSCHGQIVRVSVVQPINIVFY